MHWLIEIPICRMNDIQGLIDDESSIYFDASWRECSIHGCCLSSPPCASDIRWLCVLRASFCMNARWKKTRFCTIYQTTPPPYLFPLANPGEGGGGFRLRPAPLYTTCKNFWNSLILLMETSFRVIRCTLRTRKLTDFAKSLTHTISVQQQYRRLRKQLCGERERKHSRCNMITSASRSSWNTFM